MSAFDPLQTLDPFGRMQTKKYHDCELEADEDEKLWEEQLKNVAKHKPALEKPE